MNLEKYTVYQLLHGSFDIWSRSKASRMSAALAYYTMLSLAPSLVITVAIAGILYGRQLAESQLIVQIANVTSPEIASTIKSVINNSAEPQSGIVASAVSLAILLFGASGVFSQLYDTMNIIWGVPVQARTGVWYALQQRLRGVVMVLSVGVLLLASLILTTVNNVISAYFSTNFEWLAWILNVVNQSTSFLLIPLIFMGVFRFLPNADVKWKDVWLGSFITTGLFLLSRYLISIYLGFSTVTSVYGAAGSLVVLLIWVYFTGMIVFYGAAFCKSYALIYGSQKKDLAAA